MTKLTPPYSNLAMASNLLEFIFAPRHELQDVEAAIIQKALMEQEAGAAPDLHRFGWISS